jgi:hypothetical protein
VKLGLGYAEAISRSKVSTPGATPQPRGAVAEKGSHSRSSWVHELLLGSSVRQTTRLWILGRKVCAIVTTAVAVRESARRARGRLASLAFIRQIP